MNTVYLWARNWLLHILRVPPEPDAPAGEPGSLRVFRAGRNYYRLKLWIWSIKQVAALLGFIFMLFVIHKVFHDGLNDMRARADRRGRTAQVNFYNLVERYTWFVPVLECLGFALALAQVPFTYALIRLDYEQRWYLVTDRSLRIREGVGNVREMTLSFANIQQTTLHQGPLQRMLGLADLVVTTAGGGGHATGQPGVATTPWHTGVLHAVDNAAEIRDLIQDRLRRIKSTGTGDGDDPTELEKLPPQLATPPAACTDARLSFTSAAAAREVLAEVRELRRWAQSNDPKPGPGRG